MSNVEIFDTTFAMTILVIMALCIPTILLIANWFLHPGKIKHTIIKGSAYECGSVTHRLLATEAEKRNTREKAPEAAAF